MWKQIWEHFRLVITLTERVAKHDEDIKEMRQGLKEARDEIREINRKLDALVAIIHHLSTQIDHERDNSRNEQEKLILDNALLRFERRLPPGTPPDEAETEWCTAPIVSLVPHDFLTICGYTGAQTLTGNNKELSGAPAPGAGYQICPRCRGAVRLARTRCQQCGCPFGISPGRTVVFRRRPEVSGGQEQNVSTRWPRARPHRRDLLLLISVVGTGAQRRRGCFLLGLLLERTIAAR